MDEATYKAWWPLHLKRAQGQSLTAEEQAVYMAGRQELEAAEDLSGGVEALRQTRAEIRALEAERVRLSETRLQLQARIALLESRLSEEMKQALGVGT